MEAEVIAGNVGQTPPGWIPPNPVLPPLPNPAPAQPLPGRVNVTDGYEVRTQGFDVASYGAYAVMADKLLQERGVSLQGATGVNVGKAIGAMASGAAAGLLIPPPPVGSIVGAAVFLVSSVLSDLIGNRRPDVWANVGPGVADFIGAFAPQAWLDWAREQHGSEALTFQTVPDVCASILSWYLQASGSVLIGGDGHAAYSGIGDHHYIGNLGGDAAASRFYADFGIDYVETKRVRLESGVTSIRLVVMHKAVINGGGYSMDRVTVNDAPSDGQTGPDGAGSWIVAALVAAGVGVAISK